MNIMGFSFEDLNPNSYVNDWLKGERYVPFLFLALESSFCFFNPMFNGIRCTTHWSNVYIKISE